MILTLFVPGVAVWSQPCSFLFRHFLQQRCFNSWEFFLVFFVFFFLLENINNSYFVPCGISGLFFFLVFLDSVSFLSPLSLRFSSVCCALLFLEATGGFLGMLHREFQYKSVVSPCR